GRRRGEAVLGHGQGLAGDGVVALAALDEIAADIGRGLAEDGQVLGHRLSRAAGDGARVAGERVIALAALDDVVAEAAVFLAVGIARTLYGIVRVGKGRGVVVADRERIAGCLVVAAAGMDGVVAAQDGDRLVRRYEAELGGVHVIQGVAGDDVVAALGAVCHAVVLPVLVSGDMVVAGAAVQGILALAADQEIAARAAVDFVVAFGAEQKVDVIAFELDEVREGVGHADELDERIETELEELREDLVGLRL